MVPPLMLCSKLSMTVHLSSVIQIMQIFDRLCAKAPYSILLFDQRQQHQSNPHPVNPSSAMFLSRHLSHIVDDCITVCGALLYQLSDISLVGQLWYL